MSTIEPIVAELELGTAQHVIPLDGHIPYPSGGQAKATLVQTAKGAFLVGRSDGREAVSRGLTSNPTVRYESRMLGDRLHADGLVFGIPFRKGTEVRLALGLGRLLGEHGDKPLPQLPHPNRFITLGGELWSAWLQTVLEPDEHVLALLDTGDFRKVASDLLGDEVAPVRFLLTTERALLGAVNEVGEQQVLPMDATALQIEDGGGRRSVTCGGLSFTTARNNGGLYRELATVVGMSRAERLRRVARANQSEDPEASVALLQAIGDDREALDHLLEALLRRRLQPETPWDDERVLGWLQELEDTSDNGRGLSDELDAWQIQPAGALHLVGLGVDARPDAAEWFLPLHRLAHEARSQEPDAADADLALAEHLLLAGRSDEAAALLEDRFRALPNEQLSDLLPPRDADLTAGEAGQALRIRTLELLAAARGGDAPDVDSLAELARLQPLVLTRIQALLDHADGDLRARAERVAAVHRDLNPSDDDPGALRLPTSLQTEHLDDVVRHPAARSEGVVGWVQGWLAKQRTPDVATLKNYCERLSPKRHPHAIDAITCASAAMGMPSCEAYISHGELAHGLRAYEDAPAYLLIGGAHLYDEDADYLRPAELRHAVGSEVAHLKFGHARVTSGEVWDGTAHKMGQALDLAATALSLGALAPVGKVLESKHTHKLLTSIFNPTTLSRIYRTGDGAKTVATVGSDVTRVIRRNADGIGKARAVTQAMDKVRSLGRGDGRMRPSLGVEPHQLVVAHQVMQLTADRAGLMLSGDVRASVRAIFLTGASHLPELAVAQEHGLGSALSRRDSDGQILNQDLAIRVGALLAFYLSDDYATLRAALQAPPPADEPAPQDDPADEASDTEATDPADAADEESAPLLDGELLQ